MGLVRNHNPRCRYLQEPPGLRDPNDCNCGAIPPLPSPNLSTEAEIVANSLRSRLLIEVLVSKTRLRHDEIVPAVDELLVALGLRHG